MREDAMCVKVEVEGTKSQSTLAHESISVTNHLIKITLQPPVKLQLPSLPPIPPVAPNEPPLLPAITWSDHNHWHSDGPYFEP